MKKIALLVALLAIVAVIAACAPAPTPAPTAAPPTAAPQPTAAPTAKPVAAATPVPPTLIPPKCDKMANAPAAPAAGQLGSPDKPIVITFVPSGDTGKITVAGTAIADCLTKMTGLTYQIQVGTSFGASIEAMGAGKAQVGFLNTFSDLLAEAKYGVVPVLASMRKYNTIDMDPDKALNQTMQAFYKGEFITQKTSGIKTLADLKGKTFCFVDPNSTSGYIVPRIILAANGINPDKDLKSTTNAGSHNNVGIAVYKGDCDAGSTFIDIVTDPAANLKATYPDIADKVVPFYITDRIPNDGVQVTKDLDPKIKDATVAALLAFAKDPGGNATLVSLYNINDFQKIDSSFYKDFAALLQKAGVDPASLVK